MYEGRPRDDGMVLYRNSYIGVTVEDCPSGVVEAEETKAV